MDEALLKIHLQSGQVSYPTYLLSTELQQEMQMTDHDMALMPNKIAIPFYIYIDREGEFVSASVGGIPSEDLILSLIAPPALPSRK